MGYTEEHAREMFRAVDIYKSSFRPLKATLSGRPERTLMKLVVDAETDKVVGAHILGPDAAEMAQLLAISLKLGARKADFDATIALHPTAAEELVTMREKWLPAELLRGLQVWAKSPSSCPSPRWGEGTLEHPLRVIRAFLLPSGRRTVRGDFAQTVSRASHLRQNRVGGVLAVPSSHTTGRTHRIRRFPAAFNAACRLTRLTSPSFSNHSLHIAS